jgi:hypothetical protein
MSRYLKTLKPDDQVEASKIKDREVRAALRSAWQSTSSSII